MQQKNVVVPLIAATAALSLMGFGCNPFASIQEKVEKKVGEKVGEAAVGALTGGKVKMDADGNNWQFKDNKTGNSVAIGEDIKLPEDFPKELPIYAGSKIKSVSLSRTGDKEASVTIGVDASGPEKVASWYSETLKKDGWTEDSSTTMGKSEARNYKKGSAQISLLAFPVDEESSGSLATLVFKPGKVETTTDTNGDE